MRELGPARTIAIGVCAAILAAPAAPSLFLAQAPLLQNPAPMPLWVSTIFRGVFVRGV